ncbi:hypothetical protein C8J57DRAFT_1715763 [Mycena rebaudengoi]|nr:hypothetical protein C8J57DRAFT_1715763 [Mycena rebaudengoi]
MPPRANRSATPTTTTTGTTPPTGTPFTTATTSSKRRTQALRIHRPPLPDLELEEAGVDEPRMEEQERASPSKYPTPLPDEGSLTPVEEAEAAPPTPEEEGELGRTVDGEIEAVVGGIEVEARVDKHEAVVEKQEEAVAGTKGNGQRKSREVNTAHLRAPEAPRPRPPSTALSATSAATATVSAVSAAAAPLARSALSHTLRALGVVPPRATPQTVYRHQDREGIYLRQDDTPYQHGYPGVSPPRDTHPYRAYPYHGVDARAHHGSGDRTTVGREAAEEEDDDLPSLPRGGTRSLGAAFSRSPTRTGAGCSDARPVLAAAVLPARGKGDQGLELELGVLCSVKGKGMFVGPSLRFAECARWGADGRLGRFAWWTGRTPRGRVGDRVGRVVTHPSFACAQAHLILHPWYAPPRTRSPPFAATHLGGRGVPSRLALLRSVRASTVYGPVWVLPVSIGLGDIVWTGDARRAGGGAPRPSAAWIPISCASGDVGGGGSAPFMCCGGPCGSDALVGPPGTGSIMRTWCLPRGSPSLAFCPPRVWTFLYFARASSSSRRERSVRAYRLPSALASPVGIEVDVERSASFVSALCCAYRGRPPSRQRIPPSAMRRGPRYGGMPFVRWWGDAGILYRAFMCIIFGDAGFFRDLRRCALG